MLREIKTHSSGAEVLPLDSDRNTVLSMQGARVIGIGTALLPSGDIDSPDANQAYRDFIDMLPRLAMRVSGRGLDELSRKALAMHVERTRLQEVTD